MDIIENSLDGRALRIGIVQSRFNEYAGEGLLAACLEELKRLGVVEEDVTLMRVPGALEIPYALQQLASTEEYDALIAIGAVIRGETYHFEIVSNESASGIMQVSLDFDIPIANNRATADFIITSKFMDTEYTRKLINFRRNIDLRAKEL